MRNDSETVRTCPAGDILSRSLLLLAALILIGAFASRTFAQGLYVPVETPTDEFPAKLDISHMVYDLNIVTDLSPTDENFAAIADQRFEYAIELITGTGKIFWKQSFPMSANTGIVNELQESRRLSPEETLRVLMDPGATVVTPDLGLTMTRPAEDQVTLVIPSQGAGIRFQRATDLAAVIHSFGKDFENWKGGESQEVWIADPNGGPPKKTLTTSPGKLRLILTDDQAMTYLASLSRMPKQFGGGVHQGKLRIVLSFSLPLNPDLPSRTCGPALQVDNFRITSLPLPGKKPIPEITFSRFEIGFIKLRPSPERFAMFLGADMWDPEIIDHYNRCPPSKRAVSKFSHLPVGTAIRTGRFTDVGNAATGVPGVLMNTDRRYNASGGRSVWHPFHTFLGAPFIAGQPGEWLPAGGYLYDDSLEAALELKPKGGPKIENRIAIYPVRFDGPKTDLSGESLVIGHFYYVFDGLGQRGTPANSGSVKSTVSVSRSSYANTMRSSTHTTALEVEVSASGGIEKVFEVGLKVTGSTSDSSTTGSGEGTAEGETKALEIEIPRHFSRGTLTIVEYPVLVNVRRRGTSQWTFGAEEKLSYGGSSRIKEYLLHDGILREAVLDTDPAKADETSARLGREISGVDRNVVLAVFPDMKQYMTANVFAGQWRSTNLNSGEVEYLTVDADGMITAQGDDKPSRKIVKTGEGEATLSLLGENQTAEVEFAVSKSMTTGILGDASKIVFKVDGKRMPTGFWIKVGGAHGSGRVATAEAAFDLRGMIEGYLENQTIRYAVYGVGGFLFLVIFARIVRRRPKKA